MHVPAKLKEASPMVDALAQRFQTSWRLSRTSFLPTVERSLKMNSCSKKLQTTLSSWGPKSLFCRDWSSFMDLVLLKQTLMLYYSILLLANILMKKKRRFSSCSFRFSLFFYMGFVWLRRKCREMGRGKKLLELILNITYA